MEQRGKSWPVTELVLGEARGPKAEREVGSEGVENFWHREGERRTTTDRMSEAHRAQRELIH